MGLFIELKPIGQLDIVAVLSGDLKTITIDTELFDAPKYANRLNFSVAHELGHLILHRNTYGQLKFQNEIQWVDFISKIPSEQYARIEWQADRFTAELLMPENEVTKAFSEGLKSASEEGYMQFDQNTIANYISNAICRDFGVASSAMYLRLKSLSLIERIESDSHK